MKQALFLIGISAVCMLMGAGCCDSSSAEDQKIELIEPIHRFKGQNVYTPTLDIYVINLDGKEYYAVYSSGEWRLIEKSPYPAEKN
jgi:hypothetical protein